MKKNCIVAQSGGPTAAINASLAGIIAAAKEDDSFDKIYGSINGIQGVIRKAFLEFSTRDDAFLSALAKTPAMYLGSCRFRLPTAEEDPSVYEKIFSVFDEYDVGAFFYIGGNDSMDTVAKLAAYGEKLGSEVRICGCPKTIDNDLVETDHTPGFGSAAKYVANTVREIAYDTYIYDVNSVTIVEIMGRDAGWLTAASALARTKNSPAPHLIYLPELPFDKDAFIEKVRALLPLYRNVIVCVSEGIRAADGSYFSATQAVEDKFGHAQLSGVGHYLEYYVKEQLSVKVRSIELNVLQRCAGHITSKADLDEALLLGRATVAHASAGETAFMTCLNRVSDDPYKCEIASVPVDKVANMAKPVPRSMISENGDDVTEEMIRYLKPLIAGEVPIAYENGVCDYLPVEHLL